MITLPTTHLVGGQKIMMLSLLPLMSWQMSLLIMGLFPAEVRQDHGLLSYQSSRQCEQFTGVDELKSVTHLCLIILVGLWGSPI